MEREGVRETERQRQTETERETHTQTETDRNRERETDRQTDRDTDRQRTLLRKDKGSGTNIYLSGNLSLIQLQTQPNLTTKLSNNNHF